MAISVAGEFILDPFDRVDPGDPIGQMVGVAAVVGDATGGQADVTFTLPDQFAYVFLAMSTFTNRGATNGHHYRLVTGLRVNAVDERMEFTVSAPTINSREGSVFEPPKFITLPGPVVPSLVIDVVNTVGVTLIGNFRALVFDRHTVIAQPSRLWRDWVT